MGAMMGMASCRSSPYAVCGSAPNPRRFTLTRDERIGKFLIVQANYPDATNFEGNKIMVYLFSGTSSRLRDATGNSLDPHFTPNGIAPVARFEPTDRGWQMARAFCHAAQGIV
jgi:hypothetical protein